MDLDLAHQLDAEEATDDLLAAQAVDLGDFFTFQIERTDRLGETAESAVRYRVRAEVDGRRFEDVTLDVGFTNSDELTPELLRGPELFQFAGFPPIVVPALPLEQHVAEKLHAYTREYGERQNSRVKDLVDLVLILNTAAFEAGQLRQEFDRTFTSRRNQTVPKRFPIPPDKSMLGTHWSLDSWTQFWQKLCPRPRAGTLTKAPGKIRTTMCRPDEQSQRSVPLNPQAALAAAAFTRGGRMT
jgi:hypothetical protein